ncbi:MAG: methyltransferase domain-containing protein [Bacteroidales bacterium]
MSTIEIEKRYNQLAEESCCLSCGGAVNHANPRVGEICVDLGCGRGNDVLKMAAQTGSSGFIYGIDISDGMLDKARRTAEKLGINNVKFIRSNLETLALEDNSVDLLISNCTINHAADKKAVWKEIFRVLKTGGRFVVSDIYSDKEVPEEYRNDPVAVSECWAGAVTKEEYLRTLVIAGFKSIDLIEESNPYPKGKIYVSSFTFAGYKSNSCCCC